VEILQQSRHGNLYYRQLNLKDCNFPSKKGIDEVIPYSPENSSTTQLLSQTKRRIRNHLAHRRTNQTYSSKSTNKRTIREMNEDNDDGQQRLFMKYQNKRKIYLPVGLLSNLTRKFCNTRSKHHRGGSLKFKKLLFEQTQIKQPLTKTFSEN
jgi:hypothetical protein